MAQCLAFRNEGASKDDRSDPAGPGRGCLVVTGTHMSIYSMGMRDRSRPWEGWVRILIPPANLMRLRQHSGLEPAIRDAGSGHGAEGLTPELGAGRCPGRHSAHRILIPLSIFYSLTQRLSVRRHCPGAQLSLGRGRSIEANPGATSHVAVARPTSTTADSGR